MGLTTLLDSSTTAEYEVQNNYYCHLEILPDNFYPQVCSIFFDVLLSTVPHAAVEQ